LFLLAGENVSKVQECLQLPLETMDIFILLHVFTTQSKKKGQELRKQSKIYTSVKPVGRVIIILHHLASST
jgi:hypothetical protein